VEQICFADKVLLNKTDLVDEAKLKAIEGEIRKLNPTTPILRCQHCKIRVTNNVDSL
jgi:G3E family GTPase